MASHSSYIRHKHELDVMKRRCEMQWNGMKENEMEDYELGTKT
jgi:hypothetical protein